MTGIRMILLNSLSQKFNLPNTPRSANITMDTTTVIIRKLVPHLGCKVGYFLAFSTVRSSPFS